MRRLLPAAFALVALAVTPIASAHLDHPVPTTSDTAPPLSTQFNSGGEDAEWELLASIPTLNPHSDLDFFQQGGETYASVGNLGAGANGGGQVVVKLTEGGEVSSSTPKLVSNHPSASCVSDPSAALGLQHDIEATPKASVFANTQVPGQNTTDTKLLLDATDASGRCHDQGVLGIAEAPQGGIEIVDVTDVNDPHEIGMTSHIGEAHTVNVDPRRPHIAYVVTSDSVSVNDEGVRSNESGSGLNLDGFEVVNLRSCLEAPLGTIQPGATIEQKREACRPQVYRYRYPSTDIVLGHTNKGTIYGCHETEVYPDDRLTCGSGSAAIVFDIKKVFDDAGTPGDFTDDRLNGTPLPCSVRDSSTVDPVFISGAKVTDCVMGEKDGAAQSLSVPEWLKIGAPSLAGVEHVGSAFHMGRESASGAVQPAFDASQDIDFDHELEFTDSRRLVLATDERGGGVTGGAQCAPGADLKFANGGIHAYRVDALQKKTPATADEAFAAYAKTSAGEKAIFRAPVQTAPQGSFCTAHVFQQIPGENRIFMGWYSQGTQVVDFVENPDGTVDFTRAGYFIPENANQWVSAIFKVVRNEDGTTTYYGATGDGVVGDAGRNGIDVYKVTLPPAPRPLERVGGPAPAGTVGLPAPGEVTGPPAGDSCVPARGFRSAAVRPKGGGLTFAFQRAVSPKATVDVFQTSRGRTLIGNRRVARFSKRARTFSWKGSPRLADGTYFARLSVKVPGRGRDVRRFALRRRNGRFVLAPAFARRDGCGLIRFAKLSGDAFGGRKAKALSVAVRVGQAARIAVTIRRKGKLVKRFKPRTFLPGETRRVRLAARGRKRGLYKVIIRATDGSRQATVRLNARRV